MHASSQTRQPGLFRFEAAPAFSKAVRQEIKKIALDDESLKVTVEGDGLLRSCTITCTGK